MATRCLLYAISTAGLLVSQPAAVAPAAKNNPNHTRPRCFVVDLYVSGNSNFSKIARERINAFTARNAGYKLRVYDVSADKERQDHLALICRHFQIENATPRAYGAATLISSFADESRLARDLEALATLTVYVRSGCPRCKSAKEFLPEFVRQYPALRVRYRDIATDPDANQELQSLVSRHRIAAASVPVFHVCNQLLVGYTDKYASGDRLRAILKAWTATCPPLKTQKSQVSPAHDNRNHLYEVVGLTPVVDMSFVAYEKSEDADPRPALDAPLPVDLEEDATSVAQDEIDLPVVGRLKVSRVDLPLFTLAVGLVDGFNPCAMWVLLFLLSVLVNLRSRWKILAVAGTFAVISAAAYFAFMAAWFSVFRFVGVLREVQVAIAGIAICIGLIHVKDFFAFKQGITLSIPESAKPGIYERVRRIVTAENLTGAIVATAILAVLVNIVELLCTAGLPALYTQILNAQQLPQWQN